MRKDLSQLQNKDVTFFRLLSKNYNNEFGNTKLIYSGIVEDIDRIGNDNRVRFSILTRIIDIDPVDTEFKAFRWVKPLLPIHMMSIPEIGEEINIILSEINSLENIFWISRNSTKNVLTRTLIGEDIIDDVNKNGNIDIKYGVQRDLKKIKDIDEEPEHEYEIPDDRNKPGDTVLYGRSSTQIRQSFDSITKKGYIELVTEKENIKDSEFFKDDFNKIKGSRIILATNSNIDSDIIEKNGLIFHEKYGNKNNNEAIGLIEAEQIRLISRNGSNVNHAVLGEAQAEWLEKIIKLVETFIDKVDDLTSKVQTINSGIQSLTVGTAVGPSTPPINLPTFVTISPEIATLKNELSDLKNNFDNEIATIIEHHSKTIGIN